MGGPLSDLFGPTPECMPIESIVSSLGAASGSERRTECERHLAACPYCAAELAAFRQFESAQPAADEQEAVRAIVNRLRKESPAVVRPWWSRMMAPRYLAAPALAMAAALAFVVFNVDKFERPVLKGDDVVRSPKTAAIQPVGDIAGPPAKLEWHAVANAAAYKVRVLEVDRSELWQTTTNGTSVELPEAVRSKLTGPKKVLWDVSALDDAQNVISTSGLLSFTVQK